jgi:hypothetical protein
MFYLLNAVRRFRGNAIDNLDDKTVEVLTRAEEQGLITASNEFSNYWVYTLTESGREKLAWPARSRQVQMFTNGGDDAKRAMWDWMLMNGGGADRYDTNGVNVFDRDYLHLCACGLSIDHCSEVRDATWDVFGGTFAEDERNKGLRGYADCRCGKVAEIEVRGTVESLALLIREITS